MIKNLNYEETGSSNLLFPTFEPQMRKFHSVNQNRENPMDFSSDLKKVSSARNTKDPCFLLEHSKTYEPLTIDRQENREFDPMEGDDKKKINTSQEKNEQTPCEGSMIEGSDERSNRIEQSNELTTHTQIIRQDQLTLLPNQSHRRRNETIAIQIEAPIANIQDSNLSITPPNTINQQSFEEKEAKLQQILTTNAKYRYWKALITCLAIFSETLLLSPLVDGSSTSYQGSLIVCYIYLVYCITENFVKLVVSRDILAWKRTETWLNTLDFTAIFIFVLCVNLKLIDCNISSYCSLPLPVISLVAYFFKSKAPKGLKEAQISIKVLFFLELLLLSGKINQDFFMSWQAIFCFIWVYLFGIGIICLAALTFLTCLIYSLKKKKLYQDVSTPSQILGFLWLTLYTSIAIALFLVLLGVTKAFDSESDGNRSLLMASLSFIGYLSGAVSVIQVLAYRWVSGFLIRFNFDGFDYKRELGLSETPAPDNSDMSIEKKNVYLYRISSTYFSFLDPRHLKSKINILPSRLKQMRVPGRSRKAAPQESVQTDLERGLDKSSLQALNLSDQSQIFHAAETQKNVDKYDDQNIKQKTCISEGDIPKTPKDDHSVQDQEEKLCYICCNQVRNAVIGECGHGGICLDCAIQTVRKQGQCMECRKEASQVIKINMDSKLKDIIKGSEIITIKPKKNQNF